MDKKHVLPVPEGLSLGDNKVYLVLDVFKSGISGHNVMLYTQMDPEHVDMLNRALLRENSQIGVGRYRDGLAQPHHEVYVNALAEADIGVVPEDVPIIKWAVYESLPNGTSTPVKFGPKE